MAGGREIKTKIKSARVTLRVFCTLLIVVLISRPLAMLASLAVIRDW